MKDLFLNDYKNKLLSKINDFQLDLIDLSDQSRVIVALSGGKASAWCANWALKNFPKEKVILYFNDTKWEHEDLYRFLSDLENYFNHPITIDCSGKSPEDLFYEKQALANNRMPFCSGILKADRLQKYYKDKDILVFGIGTHSEREKSRALKIQKVYEAVSMKRKKLALLSFPLIENNISSEDIDKFLSSTGIKEPELYKLGFEHNNCSGGCVRSGKKQWKLLYEKLPEVYLERERVEREVREFLDKDIHFLKDETLESLRLKITSGKFKLEKADEIEEVSECIGICSSRN